ncbi:MAG: branched-chain amino acid transporter permease [Paucimonas sp.]|nr:branched-chain amino acid transporter permease [Paucimonas sp.]
MSTQLVLNGIAMGCIYALVALGFVILYNATSIINFAQGEVVAVGAYLSLYMLSTFGASLLSSLAIALAVMVVLAGLLFLVAYFPLRQRSVLVGVVGTIGIGIALKNLLHLLAGPMPHSLPALFGNGQVQVGNITMPVQSLSIIAAASIMFLLFFLYTNFTRAGIRMRAAAQDREMALMVGIPVNRTMCMTFVMSALIATVAGFLAAPIVFISPDMGLPLMLKGFIAIVIGGFGSIPGAILGGMLVGVLDTVVAALISSAYRDVFTFSALILMLVLRPTGIFGERIGSRV